MRIGAAPEPHHRHHEPEIANGAREVADKRNGCVDSIPARPASPELRREKQETGLSIDERIEQRLKLTATVIAPGGNQGQRLTRPCDFCWSRRPKQGAKIDEILGTSLVVARPSCSTRVATS